MTERKSTHVALESVDVQRWKPHVRDLLESVLDVTRRLGHNLVDVEHFLVAGAELGVEEMAKAVPNLAAFREALLDVLYEDRESFRHRSAASDADKIFAQPRLLAIFERIAGGEPAPQLLAETMLGPLPRIRKAVATAKAMSPEVVPPDTLTLDRATKWDPSLASASVLSSPDLSAAVASAAAGATESDAAPASGGRAVPLTVELTHDTAEDLPLVGRQAVIEQVARILLRFHGPALLLVGGPGSGKTALVRGLARAARSGELPALAGFRFHQLRILDLVSQSHRGQDIHGLMGQLLEHIAAEPTGVLVVDDLHMLVAKQGYPMISDVIDTLKMHIKRGKLRALLTVDSADYEKTFANDGFFVSEITVKRLPPLERPHLVDVLRNFRPRLEKHFSVKIQDEALEAAVDLALQDPDAEYLPPGACIRSLDEACAMARAAGASETLPEHVARTAASEGPESSAGIDRERLAKLGESLNACVLGQTMAAEAVARRVRLSKLHLDRKLHRPDGVFLFIGPSGVGKTEMARGLARSLYGDEGRLIRLDMSEYMEPHSVARIIGAPPGYVGYGEEGALTSPMLRIGHGVVLLDEIEKAHPQVLNLFLQVFDDGRLTDSKGRVVDFSDTVIIMTSNIGRELYAIHGERAIGFGAVRRDPRSGPLRDAVQDHLLRVLPSEFVNRIDEIVPFRVLDTADLHAISERLLRMESERWKSRGKTLVFEAGVVDVLATADYDPRLGARHLERNLERLVISLLSDAAVTPGFEKARELRLVMKGGALSLLVDGRPFG
ncbi:MAG: AAA family ATPase [Planctomycetota bacterium]